MTLSDKILATLAYYDVLDFPLNKGEIWRYLVNSAYFGKGQYHEPYNEDNLLVEIGLLEREKIINRRDGFYFLFGREYLVPLRQRKFELWQKKWRLTLRAVRVLYAAPFVKAIFASGSLAFRNTRELSDLDVLIVVKSGRMWLSRLFIAFVLSILGIRRKAGQQIAPDKICPNHYITDGLLTMPLVSMYIAQEYANLVPLMFKNSKIIEEFIAANLWVLKYIDTWRLPSIPAIKSSPWEVIGQFLEALLNAKLGDYFEKIARSYQRKRILDNPITREQSAYVSVSDNALAFHPNSSEVRILTQYKAGLEKLGINWK